MKRDYPGAFYLGMVRQVAVCCFWFFEPSETA